MPNCSVCSHNDLGAINRAIIDGSSVRQIADRFGLSKSSVARHRNNCLMSVLLKAQEITQVAYADGLLDQIRDLQRRTLEILNNNTGKDDKIALTAIREARSNIDLLGRLLGELDNAPKTAILIASPEWLEVRSIILNALQRFPEARSAVVNALQNSGS